MIFDTYKNMKFVYNYLQSMNINLIKLPQSLLSNITADTIRNYVSKLGSSSGFFSCILFSQNNKHYFLKKDQDFPYVPLDWTMYTLLRVAAKTIITSGPTIRN